MRLALLTLLPLSACQPQVLATPPPAEASAEMVALTGASILIGTGDIANCSSIGDEATAALVDSVLRADSVAKVENAVASIGDNAYPGGSAADFAQCFTPSWGDSAKRIMQNIRPAPGNHEFDAGLPAAYYDYFGKRAGPTGKGYYSYTLGEWHVIVLNSEIVVNGMFSDAERKAQLDWLAADLKGTQRKCTLAYWHNPRFSSGMHGSDPSFAGFWQLLFDAGADLILNGHDHDYERFRPMTPDGVADSTRGMVEIVVGTGGAELRAMADVIVANSAYRVQGRFGVLKLTLGAQEWRSAFLATNGLVYDSSGGRCH